MLSSSRVVLKYASLLTSNGGRVVKGLQQQYPNALTSSARSFLSTMPMFHSNYNDSHHHNQHPILISAPETAAGSTTIYANDDSRNYHYYDHQQQHRLQQHNMSSILPSATSESQLQYHFLSSSPESAAGVVHSREMVSSDDHAQMNIGNKEMEEKDIVDAVQQQPPPPIFMMQEHLLSSPESAIGVIHIGEMLGLSGIEDNNAIMSSSSSSSYMEELASHQFVSSPESALGNIHAGEMLEQGHSVNGNAIMSSSSYLTELASYYLVSSPESALGVIHGREMLGQGNSNNSPSPSYFEEFTSQFSTSSPMSATGTVFMTEMLDETLKGALLQQQHAKNSLPKTVAEALADSRPIVITSINSPFTVVDVNTAWEGLCGYNRDEAVHKNLGTLLQGPETDILIATDMIKYLKRNHFSQTVLTNYTKTGRKFQNRITVGVVSTSSSSSDDNVGNEMTMQADADGPSTLYFVGVLEDLEASNSSNNNNKSVSMMA
jgi:PAS domain S-box-containing protein